MNPELFARVKEVFVAACELEENARDAYLDQACGKDPELKQEVQSLLRHHGEDTLMDGAVAETKKWAPHTRADSTTSTKSRIGKIKRTLGSSGEFALGGVLALLILSALIVWAYVRMHSALGRMRKDELQVLLTANVAAIKNFLELEKGKIESWTREPSLVNAIQQLVNFGPPGAKLTAEELSKAPAQQVIRNLFTTVAGDDVEYSIWNEKHVLVAGSPINPRSLGQRASRQGVQMLERVLGGHTVVLTTYVREQHNPKSEVLFKKPKMAIVAPVKDPHQDDRIIAAVLIRERDVERNFFDFLQEARTGKSGETYAFNRQGVMISESRFNPQLRSIGLIDKDPHSRSSLVVHVRDPGGDMTKGYRPETPLPMRPLTTMAAFATAGHDGVNVEGYRDYRGVKVVGAWDWLDDYDFGVATEIDYDEMYRPMRYLSYAFGVIAAVLVAGVLVMSWSAVKAVRRVRWENRQHRVGRYTLGVLLGEGGMGKVYLAHHELLKRPTAVKVLPPQKTNKQTRARFEREVQLASQLTHPNTIAIYDYGSTPSGVFYYVMEYVPGLTLGDLTRDFGAIPPARVIHILKQICGSLREAHSLGMVHRDIKPQNIMLCQRGGESDVVKVLDFGLVKPIDPQATSRITKTNRVLGTPLYMAPERISDPRVNDLRSDIYSLGAVGYHLLTSEDVFSGKNQLDVCYQVTNTPAPRPSAVLRKGARQPIPTKLDQLIVDCLAKSPDDRPQSIQQVLDLLSELEPDDHWRFSDAQTWWFAHGPRLDIDEVSG